MDRTDRELERLMPGIVTDPERFQARLASVPSSSLGSQRSSPRSLATARLRHAICAAGLTQEAAGQLVGRGARQVRRWLSGKVSLGALELLAVIEAKANERRAA